MLNDKVNTLLEKNNGIILTSQAEKAGVSKQTLATLAKEGFIERIRHGVYIKTGELQDDMYILTLKNQNLCFSHETALFLHGLTDRTPNKYSVTVQKHIKLSEHYNKMCKTYYVMPKYFEIGKTECKNNFGNFVAVYDVERTICDIIRSRKRIDPQIVKDAINRYVKSKDANFIKLQNYAKIFRISKILEQYLEVL